MKRVSCRCYSAVSFLAMVSSNIDFLHVARATCLCRGSWKCSDDGQLHACVCINNTLAADAACNDAT